MRHLTAVLSAAAIVLMAAGVGAQAKPAFNGQWKIVADPAADSGGGRSGGSGADLIIRQDGAAMTVEYRTGGPGSAPGKLTYNLDGSVSKNMVSGRAGGAPGEQVSKAMWAGNTLIVTTTTAAGEEKRTFSMNAGELVVETSVPAPKGSARTISKVTYKKYQRGFGG